MRPRGEQVILQQQDEVTLTAFSTV